MSSTTAAAHIARFAEICESDDRVVAAFLTGSHATGTSDSHSDIDLGLITTAPAYVEIFDGRHAFIQQLGRPLFVESFDAPEVLVFILDDGTDGELVVASEHDFARAARGPFRVLVDKTGVLADAALIGRAPTPEAQGEAVRRLIVWFWHDFGHLVTALARNQLLFAYGQTEALRRTCVSLARLRHDVADMEATTDPYFKPDLVIAPTELAALRETAGSMDASAVRSAVRRLLALYQELAPAVAAACGIAYPVELERLLVKRFEALEPSA